MTQPRTKRPSWTELPPTNWAERQAHRIAGEITRLRGNKSAQWLADRTKALDHEVSRSVISDLENGRRRYVTTAELTVLAAALNVSPVVLVYPGPYQNKVEILPGRESAEFNAAQWFSGLQRLQTPDEDVDMGAIVEWDDALEELQTYRLLAERLLSRSRTLADITRNPDAPTVSVLWEQVAMYDKMIHELKQDLGLGDDDA